MREKHITADMQLVNYFQPSIFSSKIHISTLHTHIWKVKMQSFKIISL